MIFQEKIYDNEKIDENKYNNLCEDMNKNIINISKMGYIIDDMHNGNVMITDSGKLKIIDVGLFYKVIRTQKRIYMLNMGRAEEVIGEIESLVK